MSIIDVIKYYLSEVHDWIVRKPRPVESVVSRYIQGYRHWTSIMSESSYDRAFCDFIQHWQIAVKNAKWHSKRVTEDFILRHFFEVEERPMRLELYVSCARYCLTERMEGMSKYIVRGLERIYEARRTEKIRRNCGME